MILRMDYFDRFLAERLRTAGHGLASGALALTLLYGGAADAETPMLVGYQGAVFDDEGRPIQGQADIEIAVFDAAVGGTELYTEVHDGVALVDGTFDVQIGSGASPSGTFDETTFASVATWLELTVGGETMMPRHRLVAVPFALRAEVAARLDGDIGSVPHARMADMLTGNIGGVAYAQGDLLKVNVDENGHVYDDGSRIYYDQGYLGGSGTKDALVIEKTDVNGNAPDGGIVFSNKGTDGISKISMLIDGWGNVDIPDGQLDVVHPGQTFAIRGRNHGSTKHEATGVFHNLNPDRGMAGYFLNESSHASAHFENLGTGEAIFATGTGTGLDRATIRSINDNPDYGLAGYFSSNNASETLYAWNRGSGTGLVGRAEGGDSIRAFGGTQLNFWVDGSGVTNVRTLRIHGGADLSERFDVAASSGRPVEPGTVLTIDPEGSGRLLVSDAPYSTRVAGIVAGAGGIQPGMLMHQEGVTETEGQHPVALTGRVYAKADTSNGAIRPGDLLTTSARPGHAMRATDSDRLDGAILGKAMTRLDDGEGLVLVLVGLQ